MNTATANRTSSHQRADQDAGLASFAVILQDLFNNSGGMDGGFMGFVQRFLNGNLGIGETARRLTGGSIDSTINAVSSGISRGREALSEFAGNIPGLNRFSSKRAIESALQTSAANNGKTGYCGRGVFNILRDQGLPCDKANGEDWDNNLERHGYVLLKDVPPHLAPEGAILVYDDRPNSDGTGGGNEWGHVEVVVFDENGKRKFASDYVSSQNGGTVPDRYEGAFVFAPNGLDAYMAKNVTGPLSPAQFASSAPANGPSPESITLAANNAASPTPTANGQAVIDQARIAADQAAQTRGAPAPAMA